MIALNSVISCSSVQLSGLSTGIWRTGAGCCSMSEAALELSLGFDVIADPPFFLGGMS